MTTDKKTSQPAIFRVSFKFRGIAYNQHFGRMLEYPAKFSPASCLQPHAFPMICTFCGKPTPEESAFCCHCGHAVTTTQNAAGLFGKMPESSGFSEFSEIPTNEEMPTTVGSDNPHWLSDTMYLKRVGVIFSFFIGILIFAFGISVLSALSDSSKEVREANLPIGVTLIVSGGILLFLGCLYIPRAFPFPENLSKTTSERLFIFRVVGPICVVIGLMCLAFAFATFLPEKEAEARGLAPAVINLGIFIFGALSMIFGGAVIKAAYFVEKARGPR